MEINPFVVCQSTAGILGTSFVPAQRGRHVLVSRDAQALDVYSVDANKVTRSWTMRPGTSLDHRAVFLRYTTTTTTTTTTTGNDTSGHLEAMDVDGGGGGGGGGGEAGGDGADPSDLPAGAVMAVAEARTLLCWDSKDATLGKAKKVKTTQDIHSLYEVYDHAVVVCTDLSMQVYDAKGRVTYTVPAQVPGGPGKGSGAKDVAILFADVAVSMGVDDNSSADVTVVITMGKGKKKQVRVLRVTVPFGRGQEEATVLQHGLECSGAAGDVVAATCQSQGGQTVYLVWSNGDVSLYDLQLSDSNDAGELMALRQLHSQDTLPADTVARCLPGGYLALVSSVKGGATLWVYDVTYGSLQGSVELHAVGTNAAAKKAIARSTPVAVEVYKNNVIVISLSHAVVAANVSCPPVTLAHALATQRQASTGVKPGAADTTSEPLRSARADADVYLRTPGVVQVHKGMEALEDKETSVLEQLRDSKQTSNEAAFLKVFNKYVDTLDIPSPSTSAAGGEDDEVTIKPTATLSHHFITTVVTRCIQSSFTQPLLWLFNTRRFSAAPFDELTAFIIEQNDLALLEAFLLHVRDIREIDLVHIIQYVITTCKPSALKKYIDAVAKQTLMISSANGDKGGKGGKRGKKGAATKNGDGDDDDDGGDQEEARDSQRVGVLNKDEPAINGFLSLVVSVPRNDRFLVSALRTLTLQESLTLMNYLSHWYKRYTNEEAGVTATRGHGQRHPSFFQVLDWATLLIDARFSELILVPECHGFILQLRQLTNANKQMCESVSTLKGFLHELLNGNGVPRAPVADYSLEVFELK